MQHFPFIRTNSGLCVGTVQYSLVWMEVSMQLIVILLFLEAYGLPMIEILLTACSSVCLCSAKFFQNASFSRRLSQHPAATVNGICLCFCTSVWVCVPAQECMIESITLRMCSWIHLCVAAVGRTVCVRFCVWLVIGSQQSAQLWNTNKAAEWPTCPLTLVHLITHLDTRAQAFRKGVYSEEKCKRQKPHMCLYGSFVHL